MRQSQKRFATSDALSFFGWTQSRQSGQQSQKPSPPAPQAPSRSGCQTLSRHFASSLSRKLPGSVQALPQQDCAPSSDSVEHLSVQLSGPPATYELSFPDARGRFGTPRATWPQELKMKHLSAWLALGHFSSMGPSPGFMDA